MFSASTLPAFQRMGVQAALGRELILVHTEPGSASQRNVQRFGFQLVYTKLVLVDETV